MSKSRLDYPKVVLIGFALALGCFGLLFVWLFVFSESPVAALLFSVPGTALIIVLYAVLVVRHGRRLGATLVDPEDSWDAQGGYRCSLCGAITAMNDEVRADPLSYGRQKRVVCLSCYVRRRSLIERWTLLGYVALGATALVLLGFSIRGSFVSSLLNVSLFGLFSVLVILPHEMAHALVATLVGLRVFGIVLGVGRTLGVGRFLGWRWEIRAIPSSGVVFVTPRSAKFYRVRRFVTTLAGPLANAAIMILLVHAVSWTGLFQGFPFRVSAAGDLFLANGLCLVMVLWPYRHLTSFGPLPSDGLALLNLPFMKRAQIEAEVSQWTSGGWSGGEAGNLGAGRPNLN